MSNHPSTYPSLRQEIGRLLAEGRARAGRAVNTILVQTYWQIGLHIVEYEQSGADRARYGTALVDQLSKDLALEFGKGFSRSNLKSIRKLYLTFPKSQTLSDQLSWSHYVEILKAEDELERSFYIRQCERENWSVRELKRQMNLYLNYFAKEENVEDDNPPIGIVLGAYKDHILMEYATQHISNQLFVSKYQLYLPDKRQLTEALEKLLTDE